MKKAPLYSRSPRRDPPAPAAPQPAAAATVAALPRHRFSRWSPALWAAAGAFLALAVMLLGLRMLPGQRPVTQADIDAAVRESLEREPLPSAAAKAYEAILPSVVRVIGLLDDNDSGENNPEQRAMERSLGSGVVIIENGTILTNLHVVWGAKKILVRFANGAKLFPGSNVLVIDAGTCVKYDFVSSKKEYLGGSISPGLRMRFEALHNFTNRLPFIQPGKYTKLIGASTKDSILTGVQTGMVHEIDGFIEQYKNRYRTLQVVMSGGDAPLFAGRIKSSIFAAPNLIQIGLNEILKYNVEQE